MAQIVFDTYGKTRVRMMSVDRSGPQHVVTDLTVQILLEGDFKSAYSQGDNSGVLPTDTMKNTVYVLAGKKPLTSIELFARELAARFLATVPHVERARIEIAQTPWTGMTGHGSAFVQSGNERRTVELSATRSTETLRCGIGALQILKTANSGFSGFLKDEYTTLPETSDRLFGTVLEADWLYRSDVAVNFAESYRAIRARLLDTFATHHSASVQQTLFDMAKAVLDSRPEVDEIHLTMPNKHCLLVDLARFGMENPNRIFLPIDEPSGYIEARLTR